MWYKGSIHIHSNNSDGDLSPGAITDMYLEKGYEFISFTDHNIYTSHKGYDSGIYVINNSIESHNSNDLYLHILGLGLRAKAAIADEDSYQDRIDIINENEGISIICHPNWNWTSCSFNKLLELNSYHGIEIFNSLMAGEEGSHFAVDKWDYLLSFGRRVWGFAVDDLHYYKAESAGSGWIMVQSESLDRDDLIRSILNGSFYSTTGVIIDKYFVRDGVLNVISQNGEEIIFIADNGKIINVIDSSAASITLDDQYKYIRCEVRSQSGIAYIQPIFL